MFHENQFAFEELTSNKEQIHPEKNKENLPITANKTMKLRFKFKSDFQQNSNSNPNHPKLCFSTKCPHQDIR